MRDTINTPIYLDHAAATPLAPVVLEVMLPHLQDNYGNPSSIHCVGRAAFDALEAARQSIADSLAVRTDEIIFTGSGTESDNLALLGLARAHRQFGQHVIVSAIEHKALLAAATQLETEGFRVTYLPVDDHGVVQLAALEKALTNDTILVSIMYANNEIGTIEPVKDLAKLLEKHYQGNRKPLFHTDACQAVGYLPITPHTLGVDAMTINSSKIYGPKGVGLLWLRSDVKLNPIVIGGAQEGGRRAGTENVALAVGFAKALELAVANTATEACRLAGLRDDFLSKLHSHIPTLILNGHPTHRLPNNINLCIPDVEGEAMLLMLDAVGICAATGSACNASDLEPSHVLRSIGRNDEVIHGSLRFTLGHSTTKEALTYTAKELGKIVHRLQAISASSTQHHKTYATHT